MESLEQIRKSDNRSKPYPKGVRVKVVKTNEVEEKCVEVALVDGSGFIKAVCYDGVASQFKVDGCYLIRQFNRGASGVMILNKRSKISPCRAIHDIDGETMKKAQHVLDASGVVSIGEIHEDEASYHGRRVSIEGVVVEDELPRQVKGDQSVRNIRVKDDSGSIQVALWNSKGMSPVKSGDKVKITNISTKRNNYMKEMAGSSTVETTIDITVEEVQAEVVSVEGSEGDMLLLTCEVRGQLIELHITKGVAIKLWNTVVVDDIVKDLDNKNIFEFVVQGRNIIDLGMTDVQGEAAGTSVQKVLSF